MTENHSIIKWLIDNQIKTETGDLIDLKDHLFLYEIYRDFSTKMVCYKAAQIGFTTLAILKSFWVAKNRGMDIIYTMPSDSDVQTLAGGKIARIVQQNPILQKWVHDQDTVSRKRVGNNIIYYRGTWTQQAAISVSSDLNIHDEEDRSKQAIIQQYESRLQHSEFKWQWHFSNPSVEGNGVSRYWGQSTQNHWFIKCKSCNGRQYLSWPDSIDERGKVFVCKLCSKQLSREDRRVGEWVQKFKDREYSGYWISLLQAPWITAEYILEQKATKSEDYFWNFVLGLPYVGEGNKVTPDILFRNCTDTINSQENVVIGVDSGLKKHYVVGNQEGLFYYGVATEWAEIESMMKRWHRSVVVIDALPDLSEPRKLREKYPGRVFLCHYTRDKKTFQFVKWGEHQEYGNVNVDRERMIQMVVDDFADGRIPLQGNRDDWMDYFKHWDTMYRINEWEEAKNKGMKNYVFTQPFRWDSSTGEDHWAHATVYWRVAMSKFGQGKGMVFSENTLEFPKGVELDPRRETQFTPKEIFDLNEKNEDDWRL